jgi:hypothetical protein
MGDRRQIAQQGGGMRVGRMGADFELPVLVAARKGAPMGAMGLKRIHLQAPCYQGISTGHRCHSGRTYRTIILLMVPTSSSPAQFSERTSPTEISR